MQNEILQKVSGWRILWKHVDNASCGTRRTSFTREDAVNEEYPGKQSMLAAMVRRSGGSLRYPLPKKQWTRYRQFGPSSRGAAQTAPDLRPFILEFLGEKKDCSSIVGVDDRGAT